MTTTPADSAAAEAPAKGPVIMTDQLVIEYLKQKGLGMAALELEQQLQQQSSSQQTPQQRLQHDDALGRHQRTLIAKSTGAGYYGYDRDGAWPIVQWGVPDTTLETAAVDASDTSQLGVAEARAYLAAFCAIQVWVLGLPDHGDATRQIVPNPIRKAQQLLQAKENDNGSVALERVLEQLAKHPIETTDDKQDDMTFYNLPPSCKPELLSICFALLVHTYCELLEVGMETTAHLLRDAFRSLYETTYPNELRDLDRCTTVEDIVRLNSYNSAHMEAISGLKTIVVQVASYQSRRDEHAAARATASDPAPYEAKIQEYDKTIRLLKQKHGELSQRVSHSFDKMLDLPFLRRARGVRWQLTLSTASYGLLCAFFNSKTESLLIMSSLLQTKCELHVEKRNPLPFTPACVLIEGDDPKSSFDVNQVEINWAAPMPLRAAKPGEKLPFPKFHLEKEYDDETQAAVDKKRVEFNRALLTNGFRRLEAIERKREYEALPALVQKRLKDKGQEQQPTMMNPLSPSIMLMTLTASSSGPVLRSKVPSTTSPAHSVSSIWEESGIGLCCARASPPDGRRVAVGCDDSAVRIYDCTDIHRVEPSAVLLGHKNGFPVFDVDWNRDGRMLLSASGDGAVRLWDTMTVGPFGEVADLARSASGVANPQSNADDIALVSGLKKEASSYSSGAALAVYRGHVPNSPIWSVSFAPSGYYFASAGADSSARLWVTDRATSPVRLFTGHTATNVNCVEWHPNCNYVITGSDDKTARLWDIQSGRTVRLLDGCGAGINTVKISPGGEYAAASTYDGVIHIWDLGMGKKVTELRSQLSSHKQDAMMVHALSFSPCGTALATGGDDSCVRLWDMRSETISHKPIFATPAQKYPTKKTMIMDLCYTKRNLLLSVGKVVTPVPLVLDE